MNSRERIARMLRHEEADRVPITDSAWVSTVQRWHGEGLPAGVSPADFFDYEFVRFAPDQSPMFLARTLQDDGDYALEQDSFGCIMRNRKDYASLPHIIQFPCATRDDWEKHVKPRLTPSRDRVDWDGSWPRGFAHDERRQEIQKTARFDNRRGLAGCQAARDAGKFVCYHGAVGYGHIHQSYLNTPDLLMTIITDPEWVIDMYETTAELVMSMYDVMAEGGFEFDGVFLACDLGYTAGLFFSPRHFEQQLHPTFCRLFEFFHSRGKPVILHSDGRIMDLIPYFVEAGLDCLNPLEVKAGMDLVALKRQYGDKLAFQGGIDVRAMADADPAAIEAEIAGKLPAAKEGGGYIYHSDHSVPNDVSFDQYRRVIDLVLKYGAY